jgi:hypothetical protein
MAERNTPKPETAEQLGQQLLEFVDQTEFGRATFKAVSDYLELRSLYAMRNHGLGSITEDGVTRTTKESDMRIGEMRIALLEHQIGQNKSRLPGYSGGYQHLETAFDDIYSLAMVEAEHQYTDVSKQEAYTLQMCNTAYERAYEIISMKRDAS